MKKLLFMLMLFISTAVWAQPIPDLPLWEEHMVTFARMNCEALKNPNLSFDDKLLRTYYDGPWVFAQIRDHRPADERDYWNGCVDAAEAIYYDQYVVPASGTVPGYWNFTHGGALDWIVRGNPKAKAAVNLLAVHASYAADYTPIEWTVDATLSREVAYAIMAYLNAERVGWPRRDRLVPLFEQALGHIDQWTVSETASYVRPFMVALTAQALIQYREQVSRDPRILPALVTAADWIWSHCWLAQAESFMYTDRETDSGGMEPSPDLNLLIVPLYGYLWKETGEVRFRDRGDAIFSGGVRKAYLYNGKQFNQSYRWSFEYVAWRRLGQETPSPTPTHSPSPTFSPTMTPTPTVTPTPIQTFSCPTPKPSATPVTCPTPAPRCDPKGWFILNNRKVCKPVSMGPDRCQCKF